MSQANDDWIKRSKSKWKGWKRDYQTLSLWWKGHEMFFLMKFGLQSDVQKSVKHYTLPFDLMHLCQALAIKLYSVGPNPNLQIQHEGGHGEMKSQEGKSKSFTYCFNWTNMGPQTQSSLCSCQMTIEITLMVMVIVGFQTHGLRCNTSLFTPSTSSI